MSLYLEKMSRKQMHEFYQAFVHDPAISGETAAYVDDSYDAKLVDSKYQHHLEQGKQHFAILLDQLVIGDIYLKNIDLTKRSCELGIHMVNDQYKGKGYGSEAIKLMAEYAFSDMGLDTVWVKILIRNHRSKQAFLKAGFIEIGEDQGMYHMELTKSTMGAHKKAYCLNYITSTH